MPGRKWDIREGEWEIRWRPEGLSYGVEIYHNGRYRGLVTSSSELEWYLKGYGCPEEVAETLVEEARQNYPP